MRALLERFAVELRTPLQTIIGFADTLASGLAGPLADEQLKQVALIGDAGRRLASVVEDTMAVVLIELGIESCRGESFDVVELMRSIAAGVAGVAQERGLDVRLELPDHPVSVYTDASVLEEIIAQLTEDAIERTGEGSVTLRLNDGGTGSLRIEVEDTAGGLELETVERLFDHFEAAGPRGTRRSGGRGLSAAVCRRLAQLLGGDLEVINEVGKGTTFSLAVPQRCPCAEMDEGVSGSRSMGGEPDDVS